MTDIRTLEMFPEDNADVTRESLTKAADRPLWHRPAMARHIPLKQTLSGSGESFDDGFSEMCGI